MAKLTTSGLDGLSLSLEEISRIPESVIDEALDASADIIVSAQKAKGRAYSVYRTGVTLSSIKKGKKKKTKDGKAIYISPVGTNAKGVRNAEVAFVNEYGTKRQAPRPFIRDANESAANAAVDAQERVIDRWLKKWNL